EQLMERHTERLAFDVPQRKIDGPERVQPLLAWRVEAVHERGLPDNFGIERIATDDAARHVANEVGRAALPDAGDTCLGIDEHHHVALRKRLWAVAVVV